MRIEHYQVFSTAQLRMEDEGDLQGLRRLQRVRTRHNRCDFPLPFNHFFCLAQSLLR